MLNGNMDYNRMSNHRFGCSFFYLFLSKKTYLLNTYRKYFFK